MVKDHSDTKRGNMGYSFRLAARVILYAPSHRQDRLKGPPRRIDPTTHHTMSERASRDSVQTINTNRTDCILTWAADTV